MLCENNTKMMELQILEKLVAAELLVKNKAAVMWHRVMIVT